MLTSIVLRRSFPPVTPYSGMFFQVFDGVSSECGCAVTPEGCWAMGVIRRRANSGDTIQARMEAGSAPILPFNHVVCWRQPIKVDIGISNLSFPRMSQTLRDDSPAQNLVGELSAGSGRRFAAFYVLNGNRKFLAGGGLLLYTYSGTHGGYR